MDILQVRFAKICEFRAFFGCRAVETGPEILITLADSPTELSDVDVWEFLRPLGQCGGLGAPFTLKADVPSLIDRD